MSERHLFDVLLVAWLALAPVILALLFFVNAPYGRYTRAGWGPSVGPRLGWLLMETPSWAVLAAMLAARTRPLTLPVVVLFALWTGHYLYRSLVYPRLLSAKAHAMPISIVVLGAAFNIVNAYLNGRWLFAYGREYPARLVADPRFAAGVALFVAGFALHVGADAVLRRLRRANPSGYAIPRGWLHGWVSSPNYLGEIVEWCGWALAAWSLPALSFAVWTVANLAPRAYANRRWYRSTFADYPHERKCLIPFIW